MNVKDFEYLVSIGRCGSISKAAQELYISQPALSKFLQRIEAEAGTKLFQHVGKSLVPTFAGEYCIEKASEIIYLNDQINNRLNDVAKLQCGRIKIGLPMSRTNFFISHILPAFYEQYPGIHVVIVEEAASVLLQKIRTGELNLIFINYTEELPYLVYEKVSEEEMVLAAPDNMGLNAYSTHQDGYAYPCLKPENWYKLPFIMLSRDQATRSFTMQYFSLHKITPNTVLQIRNLGQALNAVRRGLGVTITPAIPCTNDSEKYSISYFSLPSQEGPFTRKTALVYREDTYLSQAEEGLIRIIKNVVNVSGQQA
ncbi:hypothetical protein C0033_10210 [Clostridium sp. chh4-2]|uniref:LysR family transcriptional regulator n=1 Tax=Clostridium sp. chh4-2 TaxID=2067550 RepID=UPI000CCEAA2B|nr:LysR family transcriptional regulator [Clostridium sp. chh4-2]PNV62018.1 hypothetical protein C0033_10210 [Clostridium sp. chh4-2]